MLLTSTSPLSDVGLTTVTHAVTSCDSPHFGLETTAANMLRRCVSTEHIGDLGQCGNVPSLTGATSPFHAVFIQSKPCPSPTKLLALEWPLQSAISPCSKRWQLGLLLIKGCCHYSWRSIMRQNVQLASTGSHRQLKIPCTFNKSQPFQEWIGLFLLISH